MSSAQQQSINQSAEDSADEPMMEVPDSPPEFERSPMQSFASQPSGSQSSNAVRVNGETATKVNYGAPGSSWQTKKFNEEYEKMESQLLDKQWDQRYGDPLMPNRG
ncbi:uncharacterized protein LY89DRAFT_742240 [Mollisia scopiformis]|uniref:Uncharacterized protein n=1 Tax=Mollisia scopiformis TaxID=149040 RepID=A0A132B6H6_MOLSC|nr:uncharacterized protein LY89DRAFT_742240 [Mollisia scopiformis]KUJ07941.1 hypothetical protein LY89DRAFT_742240 [Mollisia scopiformis]